MWCNSKHGETQHPPSIDKATWNMALAPSQKKQSMICVAQLNGITDRNRVRNQDRDTIVNTSRSASLNNKNYKQLNINPQTSDELLSLEKPLSHNDVDSFSLTIAFILTANFISQREQLRSLNNEIKCEKLTQEVIERPKTKAQKRSSKNIAQKTNTFTINASNFVRVQLITGKTAKFQK